MSKISNLIDFYNGTKDTVGKPGNGKTLNKDKFTSNSSKFIENGIMDYPKTRKKKYHN
jgi:hypothetical protein